jgi:hypothetical protein
MNRREFLQLALAQGIRGRGSSDPPQGLRLVDVTAAAGITFRHNSGAYGGKLLPETLGSGCAFLDYDGDGWPDILFVNGMDWPLDSARGKAADSARDKRQRSTLRLLRNNRNGTFSDVTRAAGLDVELYGMGVAVGDFDNDGFPDLYITCVGQNRLFRNTGKGTFVDATRASGSTAVRRSARRRSGWTSIATAGWTCSCATTSSGRRPPTSSAASTASRSRTARPRRTAATPAGCSATAATARSRT